MLKRRWKRAESAGAKVVQEARREPWGQTTAYVTDLNGFLVEICSPVGGTGGHRLRIHHGSEAVNARPGGRRRLAGAEHARSPFTLECQRPNSGANRLFPFVEGDVGPRPGADVELAGPADPALLGFAHFLPLCDPSHGTAHREDRGKTSMSESPTPRKLFRNRNRRSDRAGAGRSNRPPGRSVPIPVQPAVAGCAGHPIRQGHRRRPS